MLRLYPLLRWKAELIQRQTPLRLLLLPQAVLPLQVAPPLVLLVVLLLPQLAVRLLSSGGALLVPPALLPLSYAPYCESPIATWPGDLCRIGERNLTSYGGFCATWRHKKMCGGDYWSCMDYGRDCTIALGKGFDRTK